MKQNNEENINKELVKDNKHLSPFIWFFVIIGGLMLICVIVLLILKFCGVAF